MTEAELIEKFRSDVPALSAWGDFVVGTIKNSALEKLEPPHRDLFFKVPPTHRVKSEASVIGKAFYRKRYSDPYAQITDKVGCRFVVLLHRDVELLDKIIKSTPFWQATADREYISERDQNPYSFQYQSNHYVVRPATELSHAGVTIGVGIACEIQVRTLLQHAYSELTHDSIYKTKLQTKPSVIRATATSMALIETADTYFGAVMSEVERAEQQLTATSRSLLELYSAIAPPDYSNDLNTIILSALEELVPDFQIVASYVKDDETSLKSAVMSRYGEYFLYRQPAVLLLFYLAENKKEELKELWPLTPEQLRPVFVDLGINPD